MTKIIVKKGMPRKGWRTENVIDHKGDSCSCSLCGTNIRYEHIISHLSWSETVSTGCVCAEHLSEDYTWRNKANWKTKKNLSITIDYLKKPGNDWWSVIIKDKDKFSWFIYDNKTGDTYDSRIINEYYTTWAEAQDALYEVLESEGWISSNKEAVCI